MTPVLSFVAATALAAIAYELGGGENGQAAAGLMGIAAVLLLSEWLS